MDKIIRLAVKQKARFDLFALAHPTNTQEENFYAFYDQAGEAGTSSAISYGLAMLSTCELLNS